MGIIVGSTSVRVVPSAQTFWSDFVRQTAPQARHIGKKIGDELANGLNKSFREGATKAAEESAGTFGRTFKARLKAALASLPEVEISANSTEADKKIAQLKQRMRDLQDAKIGINTNADVVLVELRKIQSELRDIGQSSTEASVRIDTLGAAAQLQAFDQLLDKTDGRNVHADVEVDTAAARAEMAALTDETDRFGNSVQVQTGHLTGLLAAGISLGPALIPILAALSAAAGGLALPLAAAASGAAAFGAGLVGIPSALKAMSAAQDSEAKSSEQVATRQKSLQSAYAGVANAQRSLQNARASAADSAVNAEARVQSAQTQQRRATDDLRTAQLGLNDARLAARDALRALQAQVEGGTLAERQGVLDVQKALLALNAVKADESATLLQRQQAQLTYEREVFQLKETKRRNIELREEQKQSVKAGVEGSTQVVAAKDKIKTAEERVRDAEASADSARRSQAASARQGAASIAGATAGVTAANRTLEDQLLKQGTTGSAALDKLKQAMDKLSPAGQGFAKFLFGLKPLFKEFRDSAQAGLLPGLERGIRGVLTHAEPFKNFLGVMGKAAGDGFVAIVKSLESPAWQTFFSYIKHNAAKSFGDWLKIILNISNGIIGIINQFTPFTNKITGGLLAMTQSFAEFGNAPDKHPGFQKFMQFTRDAIPTVVSFVKELAGAFVRLVQAGAPIGVGILQGFTGLFQVIQKIPIPVLTTLIGLIAGTTGALKVMSVSQKAYEAVAGGMKNVTRLFVGHKVAVDGVTASTKAATGAQTAYSAAALANPIGLAIGAIILAVAAVAGGFIVAWKHSETFRNNIRNVMSDVKVIFKNLEDFVKTTAGSMGISFDGFMSEFLGYAGWIAEMVGKVSGAIADITSATGGLESANARIVASQKRVGDAARDVEKAEDDLASSRQDAANRLADLDTQVIQASLDRREAVLQEQTALKELARIREDPTASEAEREQAEINYQRSKIRHADTVKREADLQAQQAEGVTKGIEGDDKVIQSKANVKKAEDGLDLARDAHQTNEQRRLEQLRGDTLGAYLGIRATISTISGLIENRVKFSWAVITTVWKVGVAAIKAQIELWRIGIETIQRVWKWLSTNISSIWTNNILPIWKAIGNFITVTLPDQFKRGVTSIGTLFDKIRGFAKSPIDFVVRTVINGGLLGAFNDFIRKAKLPKSLEIPFVKWPPPGWAEGGPVPGYMGTAGQDSVHALLMPNEHVWTTREVAGAGGHKSVERLRSAARDGKLPRFAKGGPVGGIGGGEQAQFRMPMRGRLTSPYGMRNGKLHDGQDIAAPLGTPIGAAFPGRVWKAGFSGGWGNQVILSHGEYGGKPLFTRYAHMNSIDAKVGQAVYSGQTIGKEGSTGQSSGPHLHFGVYRGASPNYGTSVNPSTIFGAFAGSTAGATAGGVDAGSFLGNKLSAMFKSNEAKANSFGQLGKVGLELSKRIGTEFVKKIPSMIGNKLVDAFGNIVNFAKPGPSEGAFVDVRKMGPAVMKWESTMAKALQALGQNPGALLPGMLRRLKQESGGNQYAINNWDSNARKGTPSKGLMQTIDSTFIENSGKYRGRGIYDPFANIYAGLNYALKRYKNLHRIDPEFPGGLGYRGYDSGGFLPTGLSMNYNGTNKPERVLTEPQWKVMERAASGRGSGGSFTGNLYLDSGELMGKIQGVVVKEIDDSMDYLSNNRLYGYEEK